MVETPKARVFISCGQQKETEEVDIAKKVSKNLEELGFEPYIAVEEQTLKGVKENIFRHLNKSEYIIFIDFKREKLENNGYRGSLFCHQELAIATFLNIEVFAFQEKDVNKYDGILEFIQANCIPFSDRNSLPEIIKEKVKKKIESDEWDPCWRKELLLEREKDECETAYDRREKKDANWYHIKVNNLHRDEISRSCVAYLESVENLVNNEKKTFEFTEFKWKGVIMPRVAIPPKIPRYLDAFHVYHDSQNIAYLGINPTIVDFSAYFDVYRLVGPGDFKLIYVVFSDNFSPVKKSFYLHLGQTLDDIKFTSDEKSLNEDKNIKVKKQPAAMVETKTTTINADKSADKVNIGDFPTSGQ